MNAAKSGYVAEFVTGYLQREIMLHKAIVTGGTDAGLNDPFVKGFAPGRLVRITESNGIFTIVPASSLTGEYRATHIIAQSDDTIRNFPEDTNYTERQSYLPNLICKNSSTPKAVAVYKIVNVDDIKLVKIAEPVEVAPAENVSGTFTKKATTYQFIQTGINSFKVIGTMPYISTPLVGGSPAGNFLYFKLTNADITTSAAFNAATTGVAGTDIVYRRYSDIFPVNEVNKTNIASEINTNGGIECEVCVKYSTNISREVKVEVMWRANEISTYTFDLSEVQFEESN